MEMRPALILAAVLTMAASSGPDRFVPFALPNGSFLQDPAFTVDGKSLFLTRIDPDGKHTIVVTTREGDGWSTPAVVPFSGTWRDMGAVLSSDGNELIFASNRPTAEDGPPIDGFFGGKARPQRGGNLWMVRRHGNLWSSPERLPDAVNNSTTTFSPALSADGTLYFMQPYGPKNSFHIFIAKRENGGYRTSTLAPFSDLQYSDFDPAVAGDNSFVIFSSNRPPSRPQTADLFITFRHNETWSSPVALDRSVDPNGDAIEARLSPDEQTLYYTEGNPPNDLLSVDLSRGSMMPPIPRMFAQGTISDGKVVSTPVFSPDGETAYYSTTLGNRPTIVESTLRHGSWSKPTTLPFSGRWDDMDPALSPDGSYLVFSSKRPVNGDLGVAGNLWRVDRKADGWGKPIHLPGTVNVGSYVFAPTVASDGSIYFLRSSSTRQHQLFRSRIVNGIYAQAEPLPFSNPETNDYDPVAGKDQRTIVFASSRRSGADKHLHLYIATADRADWKVRPLTFSGDTGDDSSPMLSRDGKTLYFTSNRDGAPNVWMLPFESQDH